jgi:hypothetical protein
VLHRLREQWADFFLISQHVARSIDNHDLASKPYREAPIILHDENNREIAFLGRNRRELPSDVITNRIGDFTNIWYIDFIQSRLPIIHCYVPTDHFAISSLLRLVIRTQTSAPDHSG